METMGPSQSRDVATPSRLQELIDAAAEVFAERGYDRSTIAEIADRLDILKGSIYHYVKSKDDLLFAVIQEIHESALATMADLPDMDVAPDEKLRIFVDRHVRHSIEHIGPATVFFRDFRSLDPDRRATVLAERAQYSNILRAIVRDAESAGITRPDLDTSAAVLAILGMTNWIYQWYQPGGALTPDAIAESFCDYATAIIS
jgi:TetR/AcrR family transcriptional regulator, cholesterol catabolism regulator